MFEFSTPESIGVSSNDVREYIESLNSRGFFMHSLLIAKGNKLFCNAYWSPFSENDSQRMYSMTKSYVGIAVCQLAAENKISLDDKITDYFEDKITKPVHPYMQAQTIRNMLNMQTCISKGNWFSEGVTDRVKHYFELTPTHYPGTGFYYDSEAAFVLGALVERITGKTILDYLRSIALDEIGFSKSARMLKAPGGHSWGDSALLCTPFDMLKAGKLIGNKGNWNGKQLISPDAIKNLLNLTTSTYEFGVKSFDSFRYGSFVWETYDGALMFSGMHDQLMIYHPKTDITFVCTAGNNSSYSREFIVSRLFEDIIKKAGEPKPENEKDLKSLLQCINNLKLPTVLGKQKSDFEEEINGKKYILNENKMGISDFCLHFSDDCCELVYHNKQGEKNIKFGRCTNIIGRFPETGYSDEIGSLKTENHTYRCASSFAWTENKRISMAIQIIDEYIGLLNISIGFNGRYAWLSMKKQAEDFLDEYKGEADGVICP